MPISTPPTSVMLLAAGRGERMRPLTDHTPKPLLPVRGKPLMQWRMDALLQAGLGDVVVNIAWLGEQIEAYGQAHWPPSVRYSHEGRDFGDALETAGGICRVLPTLSDVFWAQAADVFAPDFVFSAASVAASVAAFRQSKMLAHIWLVPNPAHNLKGDFYWDAASGLALNDLDPASSPASDPATLPRYTYSTIGLYRKALFEAPWCDIPAGNPLGAKAGLAPLLRTAMAQKRVSAEIYTGTWADIGTPERLAQINQATSFHEA